MQYTYYTIGRLSLQLHPGRHVRRRGGPVTGQTALRRQHETKRLGAKSAVLARYSYEETKSRMTANADARLRGLRELRGSKRNHVHASRRLRGPARGSPRHERSSHTAHGRAAAGCTARQVAADASRLALIEM